ncbi:MAG: hypothetical protein QXZ25_04460 [Candidatus Bathyarchaeia archaeon]
MSEEKKQELKLVDVSFSASFKFWLAFLVVQIIAMVIAFIVMMAFMSVVSQMFKEFVPPTLTAALQELITTL